MVGNSFRGSMALALAIEHPERVEQTVLMGSVGVPINTSLFTAAPVFSGRTQHQPPEQLPTTWQRCAEVEELAIWSSQVWR